MSQIRSRDFLSNLFPTHHPSVHSSSPHSFNVTSFGQTLLSTLLSIRTRNLPRNASIFFAGEGCGLHPCDILRQSIDPRICARARPSTVPPAGHDVVLSVFYCICQQSRTNQVSDISSYFHWGTGVQCRRCKGMRRYLRRNSAKYCERIACPSADQIEGMLGGGGGRKDKCQ